MRLSAFIKNKSHKIQKKLEKIIRKQIGEKFDELSTPMLTKEEILEIFKYYDWGAHSFDHSNMAEESNRFFINDLKNVKIGLKIIYVMNPIYMPSQMDLIVKNKLKLLINMDF